MKRSLVFVLFFHFVISSVQAQEWKKVSLSEDISIQFPVTPVKTDTADQLSFNCFDKKAVYIASINDMNDLQASGFGRKDEVNEFYKNIAAALVNRYQGKLIDTSEFYIKGLKGVQIVFIFKHASGFSERRFARLLIVNHAAIVLQWSSRDGTQDLYKTLKNDFFNSLKLKNNDDQYWQYDDDEKSRFISNISYLIGSRILFVIPVVIVLALVLFINRRRK